MQIWILLLLVAAFLVWGTASGKAIFRLLSGTVSAVLALAGVTGALVLIQVGQRAHWTSDGPGMLLIMLGIPACGMIAFVFGTLAFKVFFAASSPVPSLSQQASITPSPDGLDADRSDTA